jgi:hypothetical protein
MCYAVRAQAEQNQDSNTPVTISCACRTSQLADDKFAMALLGPSHALSWFDEPSSWQGLWSEARNVRLQTARPIASPEPEQSGAAARAALPTPPQTPPPHGQAEDERHAEQQLQSECEEEGEFESEEMLEDECLALMHAVRMEGAHLRELQERWTHTDNSGTGFRSLAREISEDDSGVRPEGRLAGKRPRPDEEFQEHDALRMRTNGSLFRLDQLKEWLTDAWKGLLS